ncbi:MAG: hypothetical protein QM733_11780 [Ilumatobacteraceae bacterium]
MTAEIVEIVDVAAPDGVVFERVEHAGWQALRLRATTALGGIAGPRYAEPSAGVGLRLDGAIGHLGFAATQFALPVVAGPALDFDFHPAANLHSPPVLGMLLAHTTDRYVWLAPVDHPHDQVIAVRDGALRWGWHGDLDEVPAGFVTTLGIFEGDTATEPLRRWGELWRGGRPRRRRAANPLTSHLSYWTDNGAAYWYRTEPGRTLGASVAEAVEALRADGLPVHAVELDSWCYQHEVPRPITDIGYPEEVPPSGLMRWEPRLDAFDPAPDGEDPIERFAERLDHPPLVIHARHVSPASPYVADGEWWVDALAAQPVDPRFFRRWFDDARRWGACAIEQDWMLLYWFGVRALRAAPDRAAHWQRTLDQLAAESGVGLVWCMAMPADIVLAATLDHVVAVRTSDDYRFAADPALLWTWYLTVNRVAGALGLAAFKDCFFSRRPPAGADPIDGDEHAELEALLACMSAGPVGIGDRIGCTDRDVVMRTCDADGRIRHVDRPLALVDGCLFGEPARGERLAWATTTATRDGRVWTYVVAINTSTDRGTVSDSLALGGPTEVYDWRARRVATTDALAAELAPRDWALWVCAPPGERADRGDLDKYVTVT